MPSEAMSSIKVPKPLRERISRRARSESLTVAEVLERLLDADERRARFEAVRAAYSVEDPTYVTEVEEWDRLAGDGLQP